MAEFPGSTIIGGMVSPIAQIGVVHTKGFSSWVIRLVTGSHWNHTILRYDEDWVVSAETHGVALMPVGAFPEAQWSQFELTGEQTQKITDFAYDQLGKPYGYFTDWLILLAIVTRSHTPRWLEEALADRSTWICSQLCDAAYDEAELHLFKDFRPTGAVVPGSIARVLFHNGWIDQP